MAERVLRLVPGDDVRKVLEGLGVRAGCVVSAVGSLTRAVLRYAGREEGTVLEGPLELLTLGGTLSADGVHLHASVSDANGQVRGGHVQHGCIVRTTLELVIAPLEGWALTRTPDPATGYRELVAKRTGIN